MGKDGGIGIPTVAQQQFGAAEIGELVERLQSTYDAWNNPPSDGLPTGAECVLEAASTLRALSVRNGELQNAWDNCDEMLQACRTELETVKKQRDYWQAQHDERTRQLGQAAEAKLAGGEAFNDAVDALQFVKDDPAFTELRYSTQGFVLSALTHPAPTHNEPDK